MLQRIGPGSKPVKFNPEAMRLIALRYDSKNIVKPEISRYYYARDHHMSHMIDSDRFIFNILIHSHRSTKERRD